MTLSYETARKLKEAGFQQQDAHWYWSASTEPTTLWCVNAAHFEKLPHQTLYAAPTLEELIAACGDPLYLSSETVDGRRVCVAARELAIDGGWINSRGGATPAEAVAALYLFLHLPASPESRE